LEPEDYLQALLDLIYMLAVVFFLSYFFKNILHFVRRTNNANKARQPLLEGQENSPP
jgi:flagellar biogenesis protein FliO